MQSQEPEFIVTENNASEDSESGDIKVVDISIEQSEVGVRMEDQQANQDN